MKKVILFCSLIVFLLAGCTNKDNEEAMSKDSFRDLADNVSDNVEIIQPEQTVAIKDYTLLERMYVDVDSDSKVENIELYTSANTHHGNRIGWDDGQKWLLLVKNNNKIYPLYDNYLQLGQLEFYVTSFNNSKTVSPDSTDLERHIYVIEASHTIKMLDYYWDEKNSCFKWLFEKPNLSLKK
ncbi:MAG: hypothetical protein FH756_17410 [Firmicutes bacterium]|nr:hypothetical protein [Bacillota bacterium]